MKCTAPSVGPLVGFLDSGVGGLSIWWEAVCVLPSIRTLYLADRAHCPYGIRPPEEVRALVQAGVQTLLQAGCCAIVLACNTATAAAIETLRTTYPDTPFVGMEPAIKPAALQSKTGAVGVLATSGTCHGKLFQHTSQRYACGRGIRTICRTADDLVPYVERGELDSPALREALQRHLAPMREADVDHIVLGCTHFPFLAPVLRELVGPTVTLDDPAHAVAQQLARILHLSPHPIDVPGLPTPRELLRLANTPPRHQLTSTQPYISKDLPS